MSAFNRGPGAGCPPTMPATTAPRRRSVLAAALAAAVTAGCSAGCWAGEGPARSLRPAHGGKERRADLTFR